MLAAATELAAAVDAALRYCARKPRASPGTGSAGDITISTPLGDIVIGGPGNNRYTGAMPLLLIDIGGDDRYAFTSYNPLSIIIDVSGNDTYDAAAGAPLAAGIMGMGFVVDLSGNDRYIGQNFSFGCGLMGVGVLFDESGNDRYRGQAFTQGAGALGLGIVCDEQEMMSTSAPCTARDLVLSAGVGCRLIIGEMTCLSAAAGLRISGKRAGPIRVAPRVLASDTGTLLRGSGDSLQRGRG